MDDDAVSRILDKPQSQWKKSDLEQAFLLLLLRHKEAIDGWGSALESCDALMKTNRLFLELLEQRPTVQDTKASETAPPVNRGRGRPSKHDDLSWIDGWLEDSYRKFGQLADRALINAAFSEMYEHHGMRKSRINSESVKSQMETFRKLIVTRRGELKRLSQK